MNIFNLSYGKNYAIWNMTAISHLNRIVQFLNYNRVLKMVIFLNVVKVFIKKIT